MGVSFSDCFVLWKHEVVALVLVVDCVVVMLLICFDRVFTQMLPNACAFTLGGVVMW